MANRCENNEIVNEKTARYWAVSDILPLHAISPARRMRSRRFDMRFFKWRGGKELFRFFKYNSTNIFTFLQIHAIADILLRQFYFFAECRQKTLNFIQISTDNITFDQKKDYLNRRIQNIHIKYKQIIIKCKNI
jgi:hypothetical protein